MDLPRNGYGDNLDQELQIDTSDPDALGYETYAPNQ